MKKQSVKRNIKRFPIDFMFQLTTEEFKNWKSQIVTSNTIMRTFTKLPQPRKPKIPFGFHQPKRKS